MAGSALDAEVLARGIIERAPGTLPPARQRVVDSLRTNLTEKGAESTLKVAANREINLANVDYAINENIGTIRDEHGNKDKGKMTADETKRYTSITEQKQKIMDFLDKGYDKMPPVEQKAIRDSVLDVARTVPAFRDLLNGMSATDRDAFAIRILRDPRMSEFVKQGMLDIADPSKIQPEKVAELQADFDRLKKERDGAEQESKKLDKSTKDLNRQIEEFKAEVKDTSASGGKREGASYKQIQTLNTEIATIERDVKTKKTDLDNWKDKKNRLDKELSIVTSVVAKGSTFAPGYVPRSQSDIEADLTAAGDKIRDLETEIEDAQKDLPAKKQKAKDLTEMEEKLRNELSQKEAKKKEAEEKMSEKDSEMVKKLQELSKAKADRNRYEDDFVRKMDNVFADAAGKYIDQRVDEATNALKEVNEKEKEDADKQKETDKNNRKRAVQTAVNERYFNNRRVDANMIRQDYDDLMNQGPDTVIRNTLAASGMSGADITAVMDDEDSMKDLRQQVGENVIKMHLLRGGFMRRGGRMTPDEVMMISNSDWGKGMIEKSLAGRRELQDQINRMAGEGIINLDGRVTEAFRRTPMRVLIPILLTVLGITFGGGVAGAVGGAGSAAGHAASWLWSH